MKIPQKAFLLLNRNQEYPIDKMHFDTGQVTLKESKKVYNTVSRKNLRFDFSTFTKSQIKTFLSAFKN